MSRSAEPTEGPAAAAERRWTRARRAEQSRYRQMRLEHHRESLAMLQRVAPRHPLVRQLACEREACPTRTRNDAFAGRAPR